LKEWGLKKKKEGLKKVLQFGENPHRTILQRKKTKGVTVPKYFHVRPIVFGV